MSSDLGNDADSEYSEQHGVLRTTIIAGVFTLLAAGIGAVAPLMANDSNSSPSPTEVSGSSVPTVFRHKWSTITDEYGGGTRTLTIRKGELHDEILTMEFDSFQEDGKSGIHCSWKGYLTGISESKDALHISRTTRLDGPSRCSNGRATTLTLLPNGKLRRTVDADNTYLDYARH